MRMKYGYKFPLQWKIDSIHWLKYLSTKNASHVEKWTSLNLLCKSGILKKNCGFVFYRRKPSLLIFVSNAISLVSATESFQIQNQFVCTTRYTDGEWVRLLQSRNSENVSNSPGIIFAISVYWWTGQCVPIAAGDFLSPMSKNRNNNQASPECRRCTRQEHTRSWYRVPQKTCHFVKYFPCSSFGVEGFARQEFVLQVVVMYMT